MTTRLASDELAQLPLFAGLDGGDLERLRRIVDLTEVPAEAEVLQQGAVGDRACVILAGTLKVSVRPAEGSEVVLAVLGPGELVGELSLVDHLGRSATVIALEPCRLLWFDDGAFDECRRTMPALTENLLAVLARRLRMANGQIQALATLSVDGRVAHQLLAFVAAHGKPSEGGVQIPLRLSEADLAGLVGASRERVSQVMAVFKRNGFVSGDARHYLTVHDTEALARLCP